MRIQSELLKLVIGSAPRRSGGSCSATPSHRLRPRFFIGVTGVALNYSFV